MPQVTKEMRTETGHRLNNYDGRCSHLHGHSYKWCVTARSLSLDDKNMVMDFKDLKKAMNAVLDPLDHCMVLAPDDPLWEIGQNARPESYGLASFLTATNGAEPRLVKWHDNPTAESFAEWALESIQNKLCDLWINEKGTIRNHCDNMPYEIVSVKVWETATSYAEARARDY